MKASKRPSSPTTASALPRRGREVFGQLGGSWKRTAPARMTENRKFRLHGERGQGRFRAFALGDGIEWSSVSDHAVEGRQRTTVEITRDDFVNAAVPDDATSADEPTGTR